VRAINLIPAEQRRGAGGLAGRTGGVVYVIMGGLAVLVALGALYAFAVHHVATRKTTLAGVSAETAAVSAQASSLQQYVQYQTLTQQNIGAVAAVAGQRFDWSRAMQQIALALGPTVTIGSLSGNASPGAGATGSVGAANAADSASFTLSGCATTQLVVADLITRFRELKDVSGVTISSYSKSSGTSLKPSKAVAYSPCSNEVSWSMSFSYNPGYGLPSPKLPSGADAVRG
jgi:hypothetical protein